MGFVGFCVILCGVGGYLGIVDGGNVKEREGGLLGRKLGNKEAIDSGRKYWLGWEVDENEKVISFEVEAATRGYVGFGISPNGGMVGADIFIAGVHANGGGYYGDYYGTGNGRPTLDENQDWNLLEYEENGTHTRLRFSRMLDTCDKQGDLKISMDTARVIWAMGPTDTLGYHGEERGCFSTNFLLPDIPFNPDKFEHFDIMVDMEMPEEDTTYWCTIHKGPQLSKKHHIIAFDANLESQEALDYTHHVILFKCRAPEGVDPDEYFSKYIGAPGNHCYLSPEQQTIPFDECQNQFVAWAKGGKTVVFPDEVGLPIGEIPGENQYYMIEIHYDNAQKRKGIKFATGLRTYYTPQLRKYDAGLLDVGHRIDYSLLVPPKTKNYIVAGHCPAECTDTMPKEGVTVFNNLLHAHLSGRQIKVRQFREGKELPWMDNDDAYDFNFQQNKALTQYKYILPGDHLTVECTYDSNWHRRGQAIPGGYTSRDEMCQSFIYYYPAMALADCKSGVPLETGFRQFGITKYHMEEINGFERYYVDEPEHLRGPFIDAVSFKFNWTEGFLKEFQKQRRFGTHSVGCGTRTMESFKGLATYPNFKEGYQPEDKCFL